MHFDEAMWVALGFVLFVALVWKKAGATLAETLDTRSAKIKSELDEARKLHEEAKSELDSLKGLKRDAEKEAKTIVANAKAAANRIREPQVPPNPWCEASAAHGSPKNDWYPRALQFPGHSEGPPEKDATECGNGPH